MTTTELACCPTHKDACLFGREHRWNGPFLLDGGKPVNGETWSHPDDVRCATCHGVCTASRPAPQPAANTERDERLREARDLAAELRGYTVVLDDVASALLTVDAEIDRLDAVVTAVRQYGEARRGAVGRELLDVLARGTW